MNNSQSPGNRRWFILIFGATINMLVFAVATTAMPVLFKEIADELGLDIVQVGTVWGASAIAGIISIPAAGFLADRFGAKRVLAVFCLMAGLFGALRGMSTGFLSLTVTSLLFGMAAEAVPVIVIKNASLWFRDKRLATAQGVITAFVGGGMMVGAMISATVLSPALGGWRNVVFFYGGLAVLAGIIWFIMVPEPPRGETPGFIRRTPGGSLSHVFHSKGVWLIALAMLGFAGCNRGVVGYLPLYLREAGWSAAGADGALALLNAAGTAAAIPLTLFSDRTGKRKAVLMTGLAATILGTGMLSIVAGPAAWLMVVIIGLFRDLVWAVAATMTVETEGIGPEYAGTAVGIVHSFTRIGYTIAPPAGNAFAAIGAGLPFAFWAGLSVLALIAFSMVRETGAKNRAASIYQN